MTPPPAAQLKEKRPSLHLHLSWHSIAEGGARAGVFASALLLSLAPVAVMTVKLIEIVYYATVPQWCRKMSPASILMGEGQNTDLEDKGTGKTGGTSLVLI